MPIHKELLEVLVCPVTKQPLQLLSDEQLAKLNQRIAKGGVQNSGGANVDTAFEDGLITTDSKTIYRIDDGIPIMLAEEGIATEQIAGH